MVEKTEQNNSEIEQLKIYIQQLEKQNSDLKEKLIKSQKISDEMLSYTKECQPLVVSHTIDADYLIHKKANNNLFLDEVIEGMRHKLLEQAKNNIQVFSIENNNYNPLTKRHTLKAVLYIKLKVVE